MKIIKSEIKTNTNENMEETTMKTVDFKTQKEKHNGSELNRVEACVTKLISEMDESCSHIDYLKTLSMPLTFFYEVMHHESNFRYSFEDFILHSGVLPFYWREDALRAYAEKEGLNEEETTLFINSFTENADIALRFENLVDVVFNDIKRWVVG